MKRIIFFSLVTLLLLLHSVGAVTARAGDLPEIKAAGVLRHLGIPYANFVTGSDDGMDVELIKGFAKSIGVRYEYVNTDWGSVVEDLIGKKVTANKGHAVLGESVPTRGDLVANGFTILPWRKEVLDFSDPVFPSQIWLIARADSSTKPIKPSRNNVTKDIESVRRAIRGKSVLALEKTCLDPSQYDLEVSGVEIIEYHGKLNELAGAVISREAEFTLLDAPDALIAMEKWPGKIKIIGPISPPQLMAVGFAKSSPKLRIAFNRYLKETINNGSYARLVKKYYPTAAYYFPAFFEKRL